MQFSGRPLKGRSTVIDGAAMSGLVVSSVIGLTFGVHASTFTMQP
jgi:hypothetical protein